MASPLVPPESLPRTLADPSDAQGTGGALVILDCRFALHDPDAGRRAYAAGHVPGASYADLERDLSSAVIPGKSGRHPLPDPALFSSKLRAWGVRNDSRVVVYDDQSGAIAARLWWLLRWLGHERAFVLDGGYPAWLERGGEPTTQVPSPVTGDFSARLCDELVVSADQVAKWLQSSEHRVLDARAAERFRGEVEPIDKVAGHIPGAVCAPFADNLERSLMKDPAQLRQRFQTVLGTTPADRTAVYCGSGVTACHHVLAGEHAGMGMFRLYPGSFSEWIADGHRPVATGP